MTHYVSISKNENFFEQFDLTNIGPHTDDIENQEVVVSGNEIALQPSSSWLGRTFSWGVSYDLAANTKLIVETAKSTFSLISAPSPTTPKERIISTCRAASRTCLFVDRIIVARLKSKEDNTLKELHKSLEEHGKNFLIREANMLEQHPINVACQNGTLHAALDFIKEGGPITKAAGHYTHLLKIAFEQKQYRLSRQFIHLGADPKAAFGDKVKECSSQLLFHAIKEGQERVALVLVEHGANLHMVKDGKYPLHLAASAGLQRLVEVMIAQGADVNAQDPAQNTPLHDACRAYMADVALILVQKGADVARVNHEIDEETKIVRPGTYAFRIPALGDKTLACEFYCKILASYDPPRETIQVEGIDAYLRLCAARPQTLFRGPSGPNPFEIALLFQDVELAKSLVEQEQLALSRFFTFLKKLKQKYPQSSLGLIEYCYATFSPAHLERKVPQLDTYPPSRDVNLDELLSYVNGSLHVYGRHLSAKEVTAHIRSFIARIRGRSEMPALMNTDPAKVARFYELLDDRCLKNIIIAFQDLPQTDELKLKKAAFLRELVDLELQEHCAGRYFAVITKCFRNICCTGPMGFEDEIFALLAGFREIILEQCVDPTKGTNQSDYNYLLAKLGQKLVIPGYDATSYYQDLHGECNIAIAEQEFFNHYTLEAIISDCIKPALERDHALKARFSEWMLQHMPSDWGDSLREHLHALERKPTTTPEHIREFLRKNGVEIEDSSTRYDEALEAARKKAYLELEVFEDGKIKNIAIIRMLAGLERPVLTSDKLAHETSPTTFACNWMQDIIDMVKN